MMNQRQATVQTLLSVLSDRGVNYELNGPKNISEVLTDADKVKARDLIFAGFKAGRIEMSEESKGKYTDDKALKSYVTGLVNNWIRKAKEFNNGHTYTAKNPGSRAGSQDEQIKEMKKLLSITTDPAAKSAIQSEIDARQSEILYSTQPQIDVSKLPESLRHLAR